jgi:hypothetical protein
MMHHVMLLALHRAVLSAKHTSIFVKPDEAAGAVFDEDFW